MYLPLHQKLLQHISWRETHHTLVMKNISRDENYLLLGWRTAEQEARVQHAPRTAKHLSSKLAASFPRETECEWCGRKNNMRDPFLNWSGDHTTPSLHNLFLGYQYLNKIAPPDMIPHLVLNQQRFELLMLLHRFFAKRHNYGTRIRRNFKPHTSESHRPARVSNQTRSGTLSAILRTYGWPKNTNCRQINVSLGFR